MKNAKYLIILAVLLPLQTVYANAYTRADFIFASTVEKYEGGYLVSIRPLGGPINKGGYLNKYLKRVQTGPGSYTPYCLPVDDSDNRLVEVKENFRLGNRLSLFGSAIYRTKVARGVKFYLEYDLCSDNKYDISDVFVYIRGNPSIDSMKPVWAKNYQSKDTLYKADDICPLSNTNGDCAEYLNNAHLVVAKAIGGFCGDTAKDFGADVTEYNEYCYSAGLDSNMTYNGILVFNGRSSITNRLFCGSVLLDTTGSVEEWIYNTDTMTTNAPHHRCEVSLVDMYHMDKYKNGILLFRANRYYYTDYFLVYRGQDGLEILSFNSHQTYD